MSYMFFNAEAFNQDISNWNVDGVYIRTDFAIGSLLSNSYNPFVETKTVEMRKLKEEVAEKKRALEGKVNA